MQIITTQIGDVGTSPITGAAIGLTCAEVTGNIILWMLPVRFLAGLQMQAG